MNNNKKWNKSISIALLVMLASVATSGLVLADHFPPVVSVTINSLRSFEQYQAAIEHAEQDRAAAEASLKTRGDARSQNHLPYLDEFDQTELDRSIKTVTSLTRSDTRSENYLPYLDEFDQTGLEKKATTVTSQTNDADDGMLYWEQYFKYAR